MNHLEAFKPKKFFSKIFWIIHKFWSIFGPFLAIRGLISPDWLKILTSGLLHLLSINPVSLLTKFHANLSSRCRDINRKPLKKVHENWPSSSHFFTMKTASRQKSDETSGKKNYRRFWISNQIFDSIYGSRDMEHSLDTTFGIFGQNGNFVDDFLENR